MDGILTGTAHTVVEPAHPYQARHSFQGRTLAVPPAQLPVSTIAGAGTVFDARSRRPEAQFQAWAAAAAGLGDEAPAAELDATVVMRRQAVGRIAHHLVRRRRWSLGRWLFRHGMLGALADLFALLVLVVILAALVLPLL